jgi:tripartite motif-containing protein 2/3
MSLDLIDNEKLMHLITCPICLDMYVDPRMLPCQHTFCKVCLERISEDRWNRCPQCRKSFRIPFNGGINSFDVNRIIVQLIETLPKQQHVVDLKQPMLRAKCGQCRRDDVIAVCEHCREAICKTCRSLHFKDFKDDINLKINKLTKDSDVVLFKESK